MTRVRLPIGIVIVSGLQTWCNLRKLILPSARSLLELGSKMHSVPMALRAVVGKGDAVGIVVPPVSTTMTSTSV